MRCTIRTESRTGFETAQLVQDGFAVMQECAKTSRLFHLFEENVHAFTRVRTASPAQPCTANYHVGRNMQRLSIHPCTYATACKLAACSFVVLRLLAHYCRDLHGDSTRFTVLNSYALPLQCSAVQCSAVQCSAVQCSAVQCIGPGTAQHSTS